MNMHSAPYFARENCEKKMNIFAGKNVTSNSQMRCRGVFC